MMAVSNAVADDVDSSHGLPVSMPTVVVRSLRGNSVLLNMLIMSPDAHTKVRCSMTSLQFFFLS